jgi:hypothetical protein
MIRVTFDPGDLTGAQLAWWQAWQARADAATTAVIAEWETWIQQPGKTPKDTFKPKLDEQIWKDLRDWLLDNVFNRKCAYCETPVVRSTFHGEHFRPKGRVRIRKAGQKTLLRGLTRSDWHPDAPSRLDEVEHPGYFWLAYNWKNLLPSCEFCNTAAGKKDQFPVAGQLVGIKRLEPEEVAVLKEQIIQSPTWPDLYYLQPDDLDLLEDRCLLHPYFDDPEEHLVFDNNGIVAAKDGSVKGQHSIDVCNLRGEDLIEARFLEQTAATNVLLGMMIPISGTWEQKIAAAAPQVIDLLRAERGKYSAAAVAAIALRLQPHPLTPIGM